MERKKIEKNHHRPHSNNDNNILLRKRLKSMESNRDSRATLDIVDINKKREKRKKVEISSRESSVSSYRECRKKKFLEGKTCDVEDKNFPTFATNDEFKMDDIIRERIRKMNETKRINYKSNKIIQYLKQLNNEKNFNVIKKKDAVKYIKNMEERKKTKSKKENSSSAIIHKQNGVHVKEMKKNLFVEPAKINLNKSDEENFFRNKKFENGKKNVRVLDLDIEKIKKNCQLHDFCLLQLEIGKVIFGGRICQTSKHLLRII